MSTEASKNHERRVEPPLSSDYDVFFRGRGLDIGHRGYAGSSKYDQPVVPTALGIDKDYPGYDGKILPFGDESQDFVHSSHVLEHIDDYAQALQEWMRVIKYGGYLIITVPHKFLYERRQCKPSKWNEDHRRFYTPASLLGEIEEALAPNTYRVRRLIDNDLGYNYLTPLAAHPSGCYEIEIILQKRKAPEWDLTG